MSHHRRAPRSLTFALDVAQARWAPDTLLAAVQGAWRELVGAGIADQATPVGAHAGVLTVSCSASVWAQELDLMGPVILERLEAVLGERGITRIRCVTMPVATL